MHELLSQISDAISQLQNETGETLTLDGVDYIATAATTLGGSLDYLQGGAADMRTISVNVLKVVLAQAPAINAPAVFHGVNLRVKSVDDAQTLWQLTLEQQFA